MLAELDQTGRVRSILVGYRCAWRHRLGRRRVLVGYRCAWLLQALLQPRLIRRTRRPITGHPAAITPIQPASNRCTTRLMAEAGLTIIVQRTRKDRYDRPAGHHVLDLQGRERASEPDLATVPQPMKPIYAFRLQQDISRDLRTLERRIRDRMIAGRMGIGFPFEPVVVGVPFEAAAFRVNLQQPV